MHLPSHTIAGAGTAVEDLRVFLDDKVRQYNRADFIENDPVCIPHRFSRKQDIEIMGFWAAVLAWGQRKTIIAKCGELISLMDAAPYDFIRQHREKDLKRFLDFRHRTFNATDALYFIEFFRQHYSGYDSLEQAFTAPAPPGIPEEGQERAGVPEASRERMATPKNQREETGPPAVAEEFVESCLNNFQRRFFSLPDFPPRTRKHISAPMRNSACKRLNMFLRWMVRKDDKGVDFGLWNQLSPAQLVCPCDVHVERVGRRLGLISQPGAGWKTAMELTRNLRKLDAADPVKYDFALFGMGVTGEI